MKKYKTVIVGTGGIADSHVKAVRALPDRFELVAVADLDEEKVKGFSKQNDIPRSYTDYEEMLVAEKPDLVQIAVPPLLHVKFSIMAMEAGAWVYCEKPLCASLAELDKIEEAEKRTGKFCASVFQMRFAPSSVHVKKLIESGRLGKPMIGIAHTLWYRDLDYYGISWRGTWKSDFGGPTMILGIHNMDHMLNLMGEWEEVRAVTATLDRPIEVEDVSMVHVRFKNGALVSIINSALSPREETYLRLDFQKATVELKHLYIYQNENWSFSVTNEEKDSGLLEELTSLPEDAPSSHASQIKAMVGEMDRNERPSTSGTGVRDTVEFLSAIYKSGFTGQAVKKGTIGKDDPFYTDLSGKSAEVKMV